MSAPLGPEQRIIHFLNRTSFGPTPKEVQKVTRAGIRAYLNEQLQPEALADSSIEEKVAELKTMRMNSRELFELYPPFEYRQGTRHGDGRRDERAALDYSRAAASAAFARGAEPTAALRADGRFLEQPLQRFCRQGRRSLAHDFLRPRHDPAARPRQIPRSFARHGAESGDAFLPRQLAKREPDGSRRARAGERAPPRHQ